MFGDAEVDGLDCFWCGWWAYFYGYMGEGVAAEGAEVADVGFFLCPCLEGTPVGNNCCWAAVEEIYGV